MKPFGLTRSALFVPGNRPERVDKAVATFTDLVIIDLEDAVPINEKETVRKIVKEKLYQHRNRKLMVRVNALDTGLTETDLAIIVGTGLDAIMLPKVQTDEDVVRIGAFILAAEKIADIKPGTIGLMALIESALGVENAFTIAAARTDPHRPYTLAFGAADFCLDMGIQISKTGEELAFARARIALACRAVGIDKPLDTPFMIDLKDQRSFEADAKRGKCVGFGGKLCIHPNQVDYCNRLYSPSEKEIMFATKVVAAFEAAEECGKAAIQVNGILIDYPVFAHYKQVLKAAKKNRQNDMNLDKTVRN